MTDQDSVVRRVALRLVPLLFFAYALNYLDRTNIGFAQLQMKTDVGFGNTVYGLGAGIFFLGYLVFEVPSNLLLERIGARRTLLPIMGCWGLVAAATAFVATPAQFYIARFSLSAFEAGFFPGVIFYLTSWIPARYRARILGVFMTATVVSSVVGGPLSGWIVTALDGAHGWRGWRWLFVAEGLPASLYGIVLYFCLPDSPAGAKWLSAAEKDLIAHALAADRDSSELTHSFGETLRNPTIYLLSFILFCTLCGVYAVTFWTPVMIQATGVASSFHIGLYSAIPSAATLAAMLSIGHYSDRTRQWRRHFALLTLAGSFGLVLTALASRSLAPTVLGLSIGLAGSFAAVPLFWVVPSLVLSRRAAAGSVAFINSAGALGGFVGPGILGMVTSATGSQSYGMWMMAALQILAAVLMWKYIPKGPMAK
jgi:MFS family permease